jgi:AcrR family transcriptional regulator
MKPGAGARSGITLASVADAAAECFTEAGYRLTQIADVAGRLGLSVGALYRYVDGKETLFHVAALRAAGGLDLTAALPLKASTIADTRRILDQIVASEARWPILGAAIAAHDASADKALLIAGELYDLLHRWSALIRLLERCGRDHPQTADLFESRMRGPYMRDLIVWSQGIGGPDRAAAAEVMARGAMEAVSWLALRRPFDASALSIPEDQARRAAVEIFSAPFAARAARPFQVLMESSKPDEKGLDSEV